jgi:hypothetical protein
MVLMESTAYGEKQATHYGLLLKLPLYTLRRGHTRSYMHRLLTVVSATGLLMPSRLPFNTRF